MKDLNKMSGKQLKSEALKRWHDRNTHGPVFTVTKQVVVTKLRCPFCNSLDTVKHGFVMTPKKQRYQCKDCQRHFTET